MSSKISSTLAERLRQLPPPAAATEIPVLVTLTPGADLDRLTAAGLAIRHSFTAIPVVAGTVRADHIDELAKLPAVELIDFDGEVRALD